MPVSSPPRQPRDLEQLVQPYRPVARKEVTQSRQGADLQAAIRILAIPLDASKGLLELPKKLSLVVLSHMEWIPGRIANGDTRIRHRAVGRGAQEQPVGNEHTANLRKKRLVV